MWRVNNQLIMTLHAYAQTESDFKIDIYDDGLMTSIREENYVRVSFVPHHVGYHLGFDHFSPSD